MSPFEPITRNFRNEDSAIESSFPTVSLRPPLTMQRVKNRLVAGFSTTFSKNMIVILVFFFLSI